MRKAKAKIAGVAALLLITISLASAQTSYWVNQLGDGDFYITRNDGYSSQTYWANSLGGGDYTVTGTDGYNAYYMNMGGGDGYYRILSPDGSYQINPNY